MVVEARLVGKLSNTKAGLFRYKAEVKKMQSGATSRKGVGNMIVTSHKKYPINIDVQIDPDNKKVV